MRRIIKTFLFIATTSFLLINSQAFADQPNFLKMTRYQIVLASGDVVVFRSDGWGFSGCPAAKQVVIKAATLGFDAAFSTVMFSYANDEKILFGGICVLNNGVATDIVNGTSVLTRNK